MAYSADKKPGELTALASLATDDVFVVGDTSDTSEVAKYITKANLITDLGTSFEAKKGADDNYVTDAEKVVIGNTSGTNTGDNATNTQYSGLDAAKANVAGSLTQFVGNTAHRVFYSDASGDITELAFGADGTFLKSNGASVAPSFATPAGSGDVSKVGTPVNNQIGVWTGDGTIEGDASLTWDGTSLNIATAKNLQVAGSTVLADSAGTTTLSNIDALDATTEATIEGAIDTLANLTSIQGRTVTLADAGADALLGWDDSASAYQNLSATDARVALGLATTDSPMLTAINLGHASDTTLSRVSAGVVAVEGVNVLTTATGLPLSGGTMSGNITLGENASIDLDPAGSADGKYSGICITGTAGTTLAFGDLIYLAAADSRWELADADASSTGGPVLIGMCVLAAAGDASATKVLLQGQIRADAAFPALTIGAPVYVGETAGDIQVAIPTGADNVIRVVGFALTADEIYFNPSQDHQLSVA